MRKRGRRALLVATVILAAGAMAGCPDSENSQNKSGSKLPPLPEVRQGHTRAYAKVGFGGPPFGPDSKREILFVDVGREWSSIIGDAVDGGAWRIEDFDDGGVIGFVDGTTLECKRIRLTYDNHTNALVNVSGWPE